MSDHIEHLTRLRYLRDTWDLAGVGQDLVDLVTEHGDPWHTPIRVVRALAALLADIEKDGVEVFDDPDYEGPEPDYDSPSLQERAEKAYRQQRETR